MHTWNAALCGLLFIAPLLAGAAPPPSDSLDFVIQPAASHLQIDGTSTLHDWSCKATKVIGAVEATPVAAATAGASPRLRIAQASVTIPVRSIDCEDGTMNGKVRDALHADKHPTIRYELTHAEVTPAAAADSFQVQTSGHLTVAGTTRPLETTIQGQEMPDGRLRFTGDVPLKMKDFGVDPPTAFLGVLKSGDAITIHFEVVAAAAPPGTG